VGKTDHNIGGLACILRQTKLFVTKKEEKTRVTLQYGGALLQIFSLPTKCPPQRGTGCVRHSQDFPPRTQYMYKKHFHDAKSWPLCCISPAPASSAIAPLHREWLKKNPRSPELLKFKKSEMVVTHIQILVYYSTFIQTKASQSKSFRDQLCNMEAVKKPFAL